MAMNAEWPVDSARVSTLAATRQGRASLRGFAYQAAYAVARLASAAAQRAVLNLPDVPVALRYDWADDVEEVLGTDAFAYTQCKSATEAAQPAQVAAVMFGLAPKLLWTASHNIDSVIFRLVSPDPRFGRVLTQASALSGREREPARAAFVQLAQHVPSPTTDHALWYEDAIAFGVEELFQALWDRLQFVYAFDSVDALDPAGTLFPMERDGLNLLLSVEHTDPSLQAEALAALRTLVHRNLVEFSPSSLAPVQVGPHEPTVITHVDVVTALLPLRPSYRGVLPFRLVDHVFLDSQQVLPRERFVARFPTWADVVHGDDATLAFVERDQTEDLRQLTEGLLRATATYAPETHVHFIVGAPGGGKSTLARRVAALLALDRRCTIADMGSHGGGLTEADEATAVDAITTLASMERPILILLDDPLFPGSPWPAFMQRVSARGMPAVILAASPSLLFDMHAHHIPTALVVTTTELGKPSLRERTRLAELCGLEETRFEGVEEDLLVLAMEAAADQSFDQIVRGIWVTLNGGVALDTESLPKDLPWRVRAYLLVCYFHRFNVRVREPLLRAALGLGRPENLPTAELAYRLKQLVSSNGWAIFDVSEPRPGTGWAGSVIGAAHARLAQAAWELRPVPAFDVGEWVAPCAVREPGAAYESGALLSMLLASGSPEGGKMRALLEEAWPEEIRCGRAETRALTLFISGGKLANPGFPDFDMALCAAVQAGGRQAWLGAYQVFMNSAPVPVDRRHPEWVPLEEILRSADFSVAPVRAMWFIESLPPSVLPLAIHALHEAVDGRLPWRIPDILAMWLIARDDSAQIEARVDALLNIAHGRHGSRVLAPLLARAQGYSPGVVEEIVLAVASELQTGSPHDRWCQDLAQQTVSCAGRLRRKFATEEPLLQALDQLEAIAGRIVQA